MDAIIIVGTIPTLWPVLRQIAGGIGSGRGTWPYRNASDAPEQPGDSESHELSSSRKQLVGGPATRALREVDGMDKV